jgi:hypothetical protein
MSPCRREQLRCLRLPDRTKEQELVSSVAALSYRVFRPLTEEVCDEFL